MLSVAQANPSSEETVRNQVGTVLYFADLDAYFIFLFFFPSLFTFSLHESRTCLSNVLALSEKI